MRGSIRLARPFALVALAACAVGEDAGPLAPDGARSLAPAAAKLVVDDDGAQCKKAGYTTVQAAVDAADAMPGPNNIEVCAGTYNEAVGIGIGNELRIRGKGAVVIDGGANYAVLANAEGIVDLERLELRSVRRTVLYHDTGGRLKEVIVISGDAGPNNPGLWIDGAGDVRVEKSRFEGPGGIFAEGSGTLDVTDSEFVNDVFGVWVNQGGGLDVRRSSFVDAGGGSFGVAAQAGDPVETRIEHNDFEGWDGAQDLGGVFLAGRSGAVVRHNRFVVDNGTALWTFPSAVTGSGIPSPTEPIGPMIDIRVEHNDVEGGHNGLVFDSGSGRVKQNEIAGTTGAGLLAENEAADLRFEDNRIDPAGGESCHDATVGGGTAGTANTWKKNRGDGTSTPAGICPPKK